MKRPCHRTLRPHSFYDSYDVCDGISVFKIFGNFLLNISPLLTASQNSKVSMPSLKQLTCNLEWAGTGIPLSEYHTVYLDGHVQTYIAIPELPTPFSVHLTSDGFIAPGLAMFVFMDGEYQCNRNRTGLIMPNKVSSRMNTEIDFRVRQKEAVLPDGSFSGKQWRFEKLNIVSEGSEATSHCAPHDAEYVGMIEVVVLRCQPKREGHLTTPPAQVDSNMRHHIKTTARARYATHFGNHAMPACSLNASSTAPSASDETVGSLFDDSSDSPLERSHFGGDGGWDEPLQPQKGHEPLNEQHQWGFQMTGPDTGIYQPFEQGTPTLDARESQRWSDHRQSRDHFKQDWTQSSGQRPEAPYSQGRDWNSGSNTKGSPRVPAAQSPRAGNTARHGSSEDGRTTSAVPANTGTPAVVINVTQGTSQPQAWVEPSTRSIASKADSWTSRKTPYEGGKQDTTHNGPQMHASSLGHTVNNMPYRDDWHASYNDDGDNEDLQRKDSWETDPAERNWAINWIKKNEEKQRGEARDWTNGNRDRVGDHGIQNYARNLAWRPSLGSVAPDNPGDQVWGGSLGNGTQGEAENQTWKTAEGDASQGNSVNQSWRNKPYEWSRNDQKEKDKAALGTDPYALYSQISPDPGLTQASTNAPNPLAQSKEGLAFPSFPQPEIKFLDPQLPHGGHIAGGWRLDQSSNRPPAAALRPFSSSLPEAQQGTTHKTTASEVPHLMNESDTKTVHKKPYWSTWRNAKAQNHGNTSRQANHALHTSAEGEDPLYTVPEEIAMRKSMSHQVRPGKPIAYAHRTSSPKYMDTYDRPYAVFVFNYRSKGKVAYDKLSCVTEGYLFGFSCRLPLGCP